MTAIDKLNEMARNDAFATEHAKNPNIPEWRLKSIVHPHTYADGDDSALTESIAAYLRLSGYIPTLPDKSVRYVDNTCVNVADVELIIGGKLYGFVSQTSDYRKPDLSVALYKEKIEAIGGKYVLVHSFQEMYDFFESVK